MRSESSRVLQEHVPHCDMKRLREAIGGMSKKGEALECVGVQRYEYEAPKILRKAQTVAAAL